MWESNTISRQDLENVKLGTYKSWDDAKDVIEFGLGEFNIMPEYWVGPPPVEPPPGKVVEVMPVGTVLRRGGKGFHIYADTVDEVGPYLTWIAQQHPEHTFIYIKLTITSKPNLTYRSEIYLKLKARRLAGDFRR